MTQVNKRPSIHDYVEPLEYGGIVARTGFLFQDHVAAKWCLEMLEDESLIEVRCESQDDITLIWVKEQNCIVEFVQVKSTELDQLWTIAKLCERELSATTNGMPANVKASIAQKLLANDRFEETASFRLVTQREVSNEIRPLMSARGAATIQPSDSLLTSLITKVTRRLGSYTSPNGNGPEYLIRNLQWDVEHSIPILIDRNHGRLRKWSEKQSTYLATNQLVSIYEALLKRVQDAAFADYRVNHEGKKICRTEFLKWIQSRILELTTSISPNSVDVIKDKMNRAGLPNDYIAAALETWQEYRRETLTPKYFEVGDRTAIDIEVTAELHQLLADYDSGRLVCEGPEFHALCINRLRELQSTLGVTPKPRIAYLQGRMYFIASRCGHRFHRLEP